MQYVCVEQVPQRPVPHDGLLPQGGGKELAPPGGGGGAVSDRDNDNSIQYTPCPGHLLEVPWDIPLDIGQRLDNGGPQHSEGTTEVGTDVHGVDQGG